MSKGLWEKTIKLSSGGWLKIEVTGHPLDMAEDDRTFVEQIVDSIAEYETDAKKYGTAEAQAKPSEPTPTCGPGCGTTTGRQQTPMYCSEACCDAGRSLNPPPADHGPEVQR
jgi:hypothetical protein